MQRKYQKYNWSSIFLLCLTLFLPSQQSVAYAEPSDISTSGASYTIGPDMNGQTTITVTGNGAVVTLPEIYATLGVTNTNPSVGVKCGTGPLLQSVSSGVWQLNASLHIGTNVTLNLGADSGSTEIKLCSQTPQAQAKNLSARKVIQSEEASVSASTVITPVYSSFVVLRTYNGIINIDKAYIHSFDPTTGNFDTNVDDGRAYLLAKYKAEMNIRNSELSYLGSADGESYGIAWRDVNNTAPGSPLLTRVTGQVIHNDIHHNYYGVYTFQAQGMTFRDNQFHDNIGYGFDPHDYTHHVIVDHNQSFNNGRHGFIISRGCNNFIFTYNESYNNFNSDPGEQAQGFMLDPGADGTVKASSYNNAFSNNSAHDNEGYGLRILGSSNNQVLDNHFYLNKQGLVLDTNSTGNTIDHNQIEQNTAYGLLTQDTADSNIINNNTVNANGNSGIYLHSSNNRVSGNIVSQNQQAGIALAQSSGGHSVLDNQVLSNTMSGNLTNGLDLRIGVTRTVVVSNIIDSNISHGIFLTTGSSRNSFVHNIIHANQKYGIQGSGATTLLNTWSENQIYENVFGAISLLSGANANLAAPINLSIVNNVVKGTAIPNATVEIFADATKQGHYFIGRTTTDASGAFFYPLPGALPAPYLTALVIDTQGNASVLSGAVLAPVAPTVTPTDLPSVTPTATDTPSATPTPTNANVPSATPTNLPGITPPATNTPGATPTNTNVPTAPPTATTNPNATPTATIEPSNTPVINGTAGNKLFLPLVQR